MRHIRALGRHYDFDAEIFFLPPVKIVKMEKNEVFSGPGNDLVLLILLVLGIWEHDDHDPKSDTRADELPCYRWRFFTGSGAATGWHVPILIEQKGTRR